MDYGAYVEGAVRLVNHPLEDGDDLRALLDGHWLADRLGADDLAPLRRFRAALADVVDRSAAGDEEGVVERLNALLERHSIRPSISGHDHQSWHLHVNDGGASAAGYLVAEALFGLMMLVTELGTDRLGRCAAPGCGNAYLDTSPNRSRRFCSQRCATRVNVAAHRRRRSAAH